MQSNYTMKKIAIIGASEGQLLLVQKAKELGLYTICFAWEQGAVCKSYCDKFYPISIYDTDAIIDECRKLNVDGVISIASEETARVSSVIAENLGLNCTPTDTIISIQNKKKTRELTSNINGLSVPKIWSVAEKDSITFPCIVKPIKGSSKRGVTYCKSKDQLEDAINYASSHTSEIIIEEFIGGQEYSVESLSYKGQHQIAQISLKINTGIPHFVEAEVHQPAPVSDELRNRIKTIVSEILTHVGYTNGASHVEIKVYNDNIYLIEVNPRGAGDRTADTLVNLSTDCDFLAQAINIALDSYVPHDIHNTAYSGILFLSKQTDYLEKYFNTPYDWIVECKRWNTSLSDSTTNYERDGYLIYHSLNPIKL